MWIATAVLVAVLAAAYVMVLRRVYHSQQQQQPVPNWSPSWQSRVVLTPNELAQFNGNTSSKSYLCIMGEVYDVTGSEHYAADSGYHVFIAQDATSAFVTGQFSASSSTGGNADDDSAVVAGFSQEQLKGIADWVVFYRKHETYKFVGVLEGAYYASDGTRTARWREIRAAMKKKQPKEEKGEFPKCNVRWDSNQGSSTWCDGKAVVPRRTATTSGRCVCVPVDQARARPHEFLALEGCEEEEEHSSRCDKRAAAAAAA